MLGAGSLSKTQLLTNCDQSEGYVSFSRMAAFDISKWHKLPAVLSEICIDTTLRCGQSFRWKSLRDNVWSCALHGRIISLKQDSTHLYYRTFQPIDRSWTSPLVGTLREEEPIKDDDTEALILHYLNLKPNLTAYYEHWSSVDPIFKKRAPNFNGVRILKQDAWEALIGFICSSNNNILRISKMVENLCVHYGKLIGHIDDQAFHDFPTPKALSENGVESHLRQLGFGYRAGYIAQTARIIALNKPYGWLQSLCNKEPCDLNPDHDRMLISGREGYRNAHSELLSLQGVGPKVADCVCLMGLGWGEAVPVDTHVLKIAHRDYNFDKGKHKSLTKSTYSTIGDYFRQLWGKEAGWAHSVLFAADLKTFSNRLSIDNDIREVSLKESRKVAVKRENGSDDNDDKFDEGKEILPIDSLSPQRTKHRRIS